MPTGPTPIERTVTIEDVPTEHESAAKRRATANGEPDRWRAYLWDYVKLDVIFETTGEDPAPDDTLRCSP